MGRFSNFRLTRFPWLFVRLPIAVPRDFVWLDGQIRETVRESLVPLTGKKPWSVVVCRRGLNGLGWWLRLLWQLALPLKILKDFGLSIWWVL